MAQTIGQTMQPGAQAQQQQAPPAVGAGAGGKFCPQCGAVLAAGAKFCANCGAKSDQAGACPNCKTPVPPGTKFCPNCGGKMG